MIILPLLISLLTAAGYLGNAMTDEMARADESEMP
jgi:hypothetical protein